jgi:hypothetical protein
MIKDQRRITNEGRFWQGWLTTVDARHSRRLSPIKEPRPKPEWEARVTNALVMERKGAGNDIGTKHSTWIVACQVPAGPHGLSPFFGSIAGIHRGELLFDRWLAEIEAYRREVEDDPTLRAFPSNKVDRRPNSADDGANRPKRAGFEPNLFQYLPRAPRERHHAPANSSLLGPGIDRGNRPGGRARARAAR